MELEERVNNLMDLSRYRFKDGTHHFTFYSALCIGGLIGCLVWHFIGLW